MAALLLTLVIILAVLHWLLEPLLHGLEAPLQLQWMPWLALGLGAWLLAGAGGEEGQPPGQGGG
jgi:hypothetical protein